MHSPLSRCASSVTTSLGGAANSPTRWLIRWNRLRERGGAAPVNAVTNSLAIRNMVGLLGNDSEQVTTVLVALAARSRSRLDSTANVLPAPGGPWTTPVAAWVIRCP
jgi:hypothetical protein